METTIEFSQSAFERPGYVWSGGWFSHSGLYTGLCSGKSHEGKLIAFAESPNIDDFVHADGLLSNIELAQ